MLLIEEMRLLRPHGWQTWKRDGRRADRSAVGRGIDAQAGAVQVSKSFPKPECLTETTWCQADDVPGDPVGRLPAVGTARLVEAVVLVGILN